VAASLAAISLAQEPAGAPPATTFESRRTFADLASITPGPVEFWAASERPDAIARALLRLEPPPSASITPLILTGFNGPALLTFDPARRSVCLLATIPSDGILAGFLNSTAAEEDPFRTRRGLDLFVGDRAYLGRAKAFGSRRLLLLTNSGQEWIETHRLLTDDAVGRPTVSNLALSPFFERSAAQMDPEADVFWAWDAGSVARRVARREAFPLAELARCGLGPQAFVSGDLRLGEGLARARAVLRFDGAGVLPAAVLGEPGAHQLASQAPAAAIGFASLRFRSPRALWSEWRRQLVRNEYDGDGAAFAEALSLFEERCGGEVERDLLPLLGPQALVSLGGIGGGADAPWLVAVEALDPKALEDTLSAALERLGAVQASYPLDGSVSPVWHTRFPGDPASELYWQVREGALVLASEWSVITGRRAEWTAGAPAEGCILLGFEASRLASLLGGRGLVRDHEVGGEQGLFVPIRLEEDGLAAEAVASIDPDAPLGGSLRRWMIDAFALRAEAPFAPPGGVSGLR